MRLLTGIAGCKGHAGLIKLHDLAGETRSGGAGCNVNGGIWRTCMTHSLDHAIEPASDSTDFSVGPERESRKAPNLYFTISGTAGTREGKTYGIRDGFYAAVSHAYQGQRGSG